MTVGNTATYQCDTWDLQKATDKSLDSRRLNDLLKRCDRYILKVQMPSQQVFGCVGNGFNDLFFFRCEICGITGSNKSEGASRESTQPVKATKITQKLLTIQ